MTTPPICPYCTRPAKLISGYEIYPHRPDLESIKVWRCDPCDAHVGCHKPGATADGVISDGTLPLGRLANYELRLAKQRAHNAIDPYWREGRMRRGEVYTRLAALMNLPKHEAHIGMFDIEQCREAERLGQNALLWTRDT